MAALEYYDVILKPVITEKSMNQMADKKYTFLVHPDANKTMIKEAVEKMFSGVKVASVNTLNQDGKEKRRNTRGGRGIVAGKTAKTKKAIVKLTADSADIEVFAGL
ncbi:MAG: 50S ribosomal protein L23 [Lachnospiraceae bacterium]|nr:50S ribosomal protein L23 [Lachnospiraceae bacterium]